MKAGNSSKIYISFWGTRGSISTPGRTTEKYGGNTPCISILCGETFLIFDAGTGIRNLGLELTQRSQKTIGSLPIHLFLSHTHWDHIQGFPFFNPAYVPHTKLTIYGSPRRDKFVGAILKRQMDANFFPVSMGGIAADIDIKEISEKGISFSSVNIDCQEQIYHPGGSLRYRITINDKKIVYSTDVELDDLFDSKNKKKRRQAQEYMDFIRRADLLIADGQYTDEEYKQKQGWGHSSIPLLIRTSALAEIKQLAVFHHDPQHTDKYLDQLWMAYRNGYKGEETGMDIFWAREGMTLAL